MFRNIYQGRNVLITGHTGFKGSWLTAWLNKLGANVFGYSLDFPTAPNHFNLLNLDMAADVRGDIRNMDDLQGFYQQAQPEIIFHLAAQSLVRASYDDPSETFSTNVQGTVNVLEAARNSDVTKAVVIVTSDKCYENIENVKRYNETDRLGGHDPYSASKACAELVTSCYQKSFAHDKALYIASTRAGNVIGGGDWATDRLIPDIARKYKSSSRMNVRQPKAVRPWQHVLEPLSGYLLLGQKLLEKNSEYVGAWNFGPLKGEVHSVGEMLNTLSKVWDFHYEMSSNYSGPHEAELLMLDCQKAEKQLNWAPVWTHDEMIQRTAEWYKQFLDNEEIVSELQLETYIKDAIKRNAIWAI